MADFQFVTPCLATGGAVKTPDDVRQLFAAGITFVIDTWQEEDFSHLFAGSGIINIRNVTLDDGLPKPASWFEASIVPAIAVLKADPAAKVLVHCAGGINRGPSTAYAILRAGCNRAGGLDAATAEQMIRKVRPQVELRYRADADRAIQELGYPKP